MWHKIGALLAVLLLYFFVVRPVRTFVVSSMVLPTTQAFQSSPVSVEPYHGVGLLIKKGSDYYTEYKITGGLFFLISSLAIAISKRRNQLFKWLAVLHVVGMALTLIILYAGIAFTPVILPVMPIITKYVVPAFSLSLVPLAISEKFLSERDRN